MPTSKFDQDALSINYRHLFFRLLKNWYWFLLAVGLAMGLAYTYLRYATPIYQTAAAILIEENPSAQGINEQLIAEQLGFSSNTTVENELYILKSKRLMDKVVAALDLDKSVTYVGRLRDVDHYPVVDFAFERVDSLDALDSVSVAYGRVQIIVGAGGQHQLVRAEGDSTSFTFGEPFLIGNRHFSLTPQTGRENPAVGSVIELGALDPEQVAYGLVGEINVQAVKSSSVVSIGMADAVPARAQDIINTLIQAYDEQIVQERSQTGEQTIAFLDERLRYVTQELYAVEANVAGLKQREGLSVDISTRGADYLEQLNEADAQLAELEIRKDLLQDIRQTLNAPGNDYQPITAVSEVMDGALSGLVKTYNDLIFERDTRLEVATEANPIVTTYSERLANVKRSIVRGLETSIQETSNRLGRLEQRIRPLERSMNQIPQNERQLIQIMRQQQIKQNLFVFLLERREEAALSVAAQIPNTRVINEAMTFSAPIKPKPTQSYLLAIALGLILPAMVILGREIADNSIRTEQEIEQALSVPIVGRIAKSRNRDKLVMKADARSGAAEMFRLLRTNLNFMLADTPNAVVLITSAVSGDGKTFVSANLAHSLALGSKKVCVLTTDLRKPKLTDLLMEGNDKGQATGLSNYLIGKATYEEIVQATDDENLSYIASGPIPPNPSELLLKPELKTLMKRLRGDFDIVIVDTAPVGLVTDALLLKGVVDLSLFVISIGITPRWSAGVIRDVVENDKLPRVSTIVNNIEPTRDYGYGYAHGYFE